MINHPILGQPIFRQTHLVAFYVCFLHCWRFNIWEEISTAEWWHVQWLQGFKSNL